MKSLRESLFDKDLDKKDLKPTFAGFEINPMPVIYKGGKFRFARDWNELSRGKVYGLEEGSTYFNWEQCHDVKIGSWRVPAESEWKKIINRGMHDIVRTGKQKGIIFYPDYFDPALRIKKTLITSDQLDEYLKIGCVFLSYTGFYLNTGTSSNGSWDDSNGSWDSIQFNDVGYYWSSTEVSYTSVVPRAYSLSFQLERRGAYVSSNCQNMKERNYFPLILIK